MEKTISIDGKDLKFKATANTPRVYRQAFGRDIYTDISVLIAGFNSDEPLPITALDVFENVAYCLNSQAEGREMNRESLEKDMAKWLDQFETFSIYRILPQIMELWRSTNEQTSVPKNQAARQNDQ